MGKLGLQKFIEFQPMVVVADIRMPTMGGPEMIAEIQKRNPYVQYLIMSAYGDFDYPRQALQMGVADYILKTDICLRTFAEAVGFSANHLSAKLRQEPGITVNDYLAQIRIDQSRCLLKSGRYKVYEIAEMVGYRNVTYFSSVFHQKTGLTPNRHAGEV